MAPFTFTLLLARCVVVIAVQLYATVYLHYRVVKRKRPSTDAMLCNPDVTPQLSVSISVCVCVFGCKSALLSL